MFFLAINLKKKKKIMISVAESVEIKTVIVCETAPRYNILRQSSLDSFENCVKGLWQHHCVNSYHGSLHESQRGRIQSVLSSLEILWYPYKPSGVFRSEKILWPSHNALLPMGCFEQVVRWVVSDKTCLKSQMQDWDDF